MLSRLAPTPSGFLHRGNAVSFLITWLWVKKEKGRLLLRIDDLDNERYRDEYLSDIFESIDWLGIDYDEGPRNREEFLSTWSQRFRRPLYHHALESLMKNSGLCFACDCSRTQLRSTGATVYPGTCVTRNLPYDTPDSALRLFVSPDSEVNLTDCLQGTISMKPGLSPGSFIIRRRDGLPAYHLCSLVDDLHFGITHIVRGEDLFPASAAQIYLAGKLGQNTFGQTRFLHHPLLHDPAGNKLSKSMGSSSLMDMRKAGIGPGSIYRETARMLGMKDIEYGDAANLLDAFAGFQCRS